MGSLPSSRATASARQLRHDLEYARARAKSLSLNHWVSFTTGAGTYTVYEESRATPGRANATVLTDPTTGKGLVRSVSGNGHDGVTLASASFNGGAWVGFDVYGKPMDSAGATLASDGTATLASGGVTRVVTVTAYTGVVQGP